MPTKPTQETLNAAETMRKNPDFAKDVLMAVINESAVLREALLKEGLVKEV